MTHADFHRAVAALAGGAYHSTQVEVTTNQAMAPESGGTEVTYRAYIAERGWSETHRHPEAVLADLVRLPQTRTTVESVGDAAVEVSP